MSRYEKLVKIQGAVVANAENLKQEIWVLLEECGEPPFDIKGTMNQLLDEIESLEFDNHE